MFNELYQSGKQIVITSDRLPKDIPNLTAALDSRFAMGLMVELVAPEENNRFEILKKLAVDNDLNFEEKALKFIEKKRSLFHHLLVTLSKVQSMNIIYL